MAKSKLERLDAREAVVGVEIRYRTEEPPLGTLGIELLEIDRAVREVIRQARRDEPPMGRQGWPSLNDSVRVVRAETRSPLGVEATGYFIGILSSLSATALTALIKSAIAARFKSRPPERPSIEIVVTVKIDGESGKGQISLGDQGQAD
jgi:hypothetical protein